ncbi:MAG: nicotinate-nucleotide diphosphorylase (carboxylating) [Bacteroidia bacterium]|nr:MAG: nicotinate-nucleotide diphosphorylase (carboxylating) [Bacteroidia bacterium]
MRSFIEIYSQHFSLQQFVNLALKEDIGYGDVTSLSIIPSDKMGTMQLLVKQEGVIAGVEAIQHILQYIYPECEMQVFINDGSTVRKGDVVFRINGSVQRLLSYERLLLNIMQRMSGIATKTSYLQSLCEGTRARITDTRKTTPLFRFFEKWAVHIGGGVNHRWGLYDMVLIKDNHIDAAGGIDKAIIKCREYLQKNNLNVKIEVETRSLDDVKMAIEYKPDRIMFDNFTVEDVRRAVELVNYQVETEASGGINEQNLRDYAQTGVELISIGALTHHINSLDLSLKLIS